MTRTLYRLFSPLRMLILLMLFGTSIVWAQGRLRDRTPPTAPTNLVVTATSTNSVTLAWGPSTDNSGSFSYIVCCAKGSVTVSQHQTSYTRQGLDPGATYIFRVYAKDAAGNLSASSNAVTVTLPGTIAAPTKPTVSILDVGPTHVSLSWLSTDNGPYIWYTIFRDGQQVTTLNSTSATFATLANQFDLIICTVSSPIDWNAYLQLLKVDGTFVIVGAPEQPVPINAFTVIMSRRTLAGSAIG